MDVRVTGQEVRNTAAEAPESATVVPLPGVSLTGSWLDLMDEADRLGRDPSLAALDDDALCDQVRTQAAEVTAATARWLLLVAEFVVRRVWAQQGARNPGEWLSWAVGTSVTTAREHVRVGLALRSLPETRERFLAGTLSYSKVRAISRVAVPQVEALLLRYADGATAAQLDRIVSSMRATGDVDDVEAEARRGVWVRDVGGMTEVRILVPRLEGRRVEAAIDAAVAALDEAGEPMPIGEDDGSVSDEAVGPVPRVREAMAARRADAFVHLVAAGVDRVGEDRTGRDDATLVLHVGIGTARDLAALADGADGADAPAEAPPADGADAPAEAAPRVPVVSGSGRTGSMSRSSLERLACEAGVIALLNGEDAAPLDAGRRFRYATARQKLALQARDSGCRFPGCTGTAHLHAHHVAHWENGGATDMGNLVLLCGTHHRFLHAQGWRMALDAAGHVRVGPADGPWLATALPGVGAPAGAAAERSARSGIRSSLLDLRPPDAHPGRIELGLAVELLCIAIDRLAPPADAPADAPAGVAA